MAGPIDRREVVQDRLAKDANSSLPDRSAPAIGVRGPGMPSMSAFNQPIDVDRNAGAALTGVANAMGNIQQLVGQHFERKKDDWVAEGKAAYMKGASEAELIRTGNRYTQAGYQQLKVADAINNWTLQKQAEITQGDAEIDPDAYQENLSRQRQEFLDGTTDEYGKRVATSAFERTYPSLVEQQFKANNEYNKQQRKTAFSDLIGSTSASSPQRSVRDPSNKTGLFVSPTVVSPPVKVSDDDLHIATLTMLGEAASEGDEGLAAVAHILKNRSFDKRWGGSIKDVALDPKQFSAWNKGAGGNNPEGRYAVGSARYDRAMEIAKTVFSGRHEDRTGGAVYYYSPAGMKSLVKSGAQSNLVPNWLAAATKESGGTVRIGGHVFAGKGAGDYGNPKVDTVQGTLGDATVKEANLQSVEQEGVNPVTPTRDPKPVNEIRDQVLNYSGLSNADKVVEVAKSMIAGIEAGDDQLYRDLGGESILRDLGATPDQLRAVEKARKNYDDKQLTKFNADHETWRAGILERADDPSTNHADLTREIDERYKAGWMNDEEARGLSRSIAQTKRAMAGPESIYNNPEALNELSSVITDVKNGDLQGQAAFEAVQELGTKYNLDQKEVEKFSGELLGEIQRREDGLRNEAKKRAEEAQQNEQKLHEISHAVATNQIGSLSGNVKVKDETGRTNSVPAKQFAIDQLKRQSVEQALEVGKAQGMQPKQITNLSYTTAYRKLAEQGVVDPQFAPMMRGSLTGDLTEADGKTIRPDAIANFETYKALREDPHIPDEYLAKSIPDTWVRGLLETAYELDAGNIDPGDALRRARMQLDSPQRAPEAKLVKDKQMSTDLKAAAQSDARELLGEQQGWFNRQVQRFNEWTGVADRDRTSSFAVTSRAIEQSNLSSAQHYLFGRAQAYYQENGNLSKETVLKMAQDDLKNNSKLVAGNLILHRPDDNLSARMHGGQVEDTDPDYASNAVERFLRSEGDKLFPATDLTNAKGERVYPEGWLNALRGRDTWDSAQYPQYKISFYPDQNAFRIQRVRDPATGEVFPKDILYPLTGIGDWYEAEKEKDSNGLWGTITKGITSGVEAGARAIGDTVRGPSPKDVLATGLRDGSRRSRGPHNQFDISNTEN